MEVDEDGSIRRPVTAGESGLGLPYAPEDWPNPGDKWSWKVGRRKAPSGFWTDRYLYPPDRLRSKSQPGKSSAFASRLAVEKFLRRHFPNADINAFFASFSWKIPCVASTPPVSDCSESDNSLDLQPMKLELSEHTGSESTFGVMDCKAGNKMCNVQMQARNHSHEAMDCDICCNEPGFCRDCCCILCCKTIDWEYDGYSFIKCEASVSGNYICGHIAHVNCALRSYMAGTVGGIIGLDVEYYCRRCDKKTDLISHVERTFQTCQSLNSRDEIEKILKLGLCILHGSERTSAKNLMSHMELVLAKLKSGIYVEDVWKADEDIQMVSAGASHLENGTALSGPLNVLSNEDVLDFTSGFESSHEPDDEFGKEHTPVCIASDYQIASLHLENEIDGVLESLKKSQDWEHKLAEQKLYAHKDFVLGLYQQLDAERSAKDGSDACLTDVFSRADRLKQEVIKLRHMMEIAKGFGRTSKVILKEHFGRAPFLSYFIRQTYMKVLFNTRVKSLNLHISNFRCVSILVWFLAQYPKKAKDDLTQSMTQSEVLTEGLVSEY